MKLYYLFLLVMFLLMGCTNSSNISGPNTIGTSKVHGDVYSYVIDGHEYIKLGNGFCTFWYLQENVRQIWKVLSVK